MPPSSDDWYQSTMTKLQSWRIQTVKRKRGGLISRGAETNKFTPWAFQFVCLGSLAWMTLVAVPHHYTHNLAWFLLTEAFTIFAFTHVMINWLFICFTASTYNPTETTSMTLTSDRANTKGDDVMMRDQGSTAAGGSRIMVATAIGDNQVERQSVLYWSWTQCVMCHKKRPPRCHHCTLCQQCVLKRDHHCYFTRNCVGMYNQRYFIYFLFWCVVFTILGCYQMLPYIFNDVCYRYSYVDLIVPVNVFRAIRGHFPCLYCHLVIVMWGGLFLTFLSAVMFTHSLYLVLIGQTKFEHDSGIKIIDTRTIPDRVRSVMGRNWAVGLLIPGGSSYSFVRSNIPAWLKPSPPLEDPVNWPFIKN